MTQTYAERMQPIQMCLNPLEAFSCDYLPFTTTKRKVAILMEKVNFSVW